MYVAVFPLSKSWAWLDFFFFSPLLILWNVRGQGQLADKEISQVLASSSIQDAAPNRKQSLDSDVSTHTMLGFMIAIRKKEYFFLCRKE